MTKMFCDYCGAEIQTDRTRWYTVKLHDPECALLDLASPREVCRSCIDKIAPQEQHTDICTDEKNPKKKEATT